MNQKPVASWSQLAGFGGLVDNVESALNEGVGGAYFDPGFYKDVFIESLEPKMSQAGNPMISVTLKDDRGTSIRHRVMLSAGKEGKGFHFTYNQFAAAVCPEPQLRMKLFGRLFRENPALMDCLRGARLSMDVGQGRQGYTIQKDALDNHIVVDVQTKKAPEDLEGQVFTSYSEAKEAAEALSLQRAHNEVKRVTKPSDNYIAATEAVLSEVVRTAESGAGPKAPTTSRANKPRPTI